MVKWDAIIVGAGPCGLGTGALLANAGKKVLVLEKDNHIGGRAFSVQYKGHFLDTGAHIPGNIGFIEEELSRVGKPYPKLEPIMQGFEIWQDGEWQTSNKFMSRPDFRKIMESVASSSYEELENLDDVSIETWISSKTADKDVQLWWGTWGEWIVGGEQPDSISAGEVLAFTKKHIEKYGRLSSHAANPVGGVVKYVEPLAEVIKAKGGQIKTGVEVSRICVEGGKVKGVEVGKEAKAMDAHIVDTELIEAPIVISTLPLWNLFKIISQDEFPLWYSQWIENIKQRVTSFFIVTHAVDKPLWKSTIARFVPTLPRLKASMAAFYNTSYGESAGQYQMHFGMQVAWGNFPSFFQYDQAKTKIQVKKTFDILEEEIAELFPDLKRHSLWNIKSSFPYTIAVTPSLVGKGRPYMQPPGVENLYLVSDTIREARVGPGLEAAACISLLCADVILGKK